MPHWLFYPYPQPFMPNRYQLAFLSSTLLSFFSLFFVSRYIHRFLLNAGYDPANIILIGLPNHSSSQTPSPPLMASSLFDTLRAVPLPVIGETDLVQVVTSPAFFASAFVLAGTAYFISQTGTCVTSRVFSILNTEKPSQASPRSSIPKNGSNSRSMRKSKFLLTQPCESHAPNPPPTRFLTNYFP